MPRSCEARTITLAAQGGTGEVSAIYKMQNQTYLKLLLNSINAANQTMNERNNIFLNGCNKTVIDVDAQDNDNKGRASIEYPPLN